MHALVMAPHVPSSAYRCPTFWALYALVKTHDVTSNFFLLLSRFVKKTSSFRILILNLCSDLPQAFCVLYSWFTQENKLMP